MGPYCSHVIVFLACGGTSRCERILCGNCSAPFMNFHSFIQSLFIGIEIFFLKARRQTYTHKLLQQPFKCSPGEIASRQQEAEANNSGTKSTTTTTVQAKVMLANE